jgi:hypothetical protein
VEEVDSNTNKQRETGQQEWEKDPETRDRFMKSAHSFMEWVFEEYGFEVLTPDMVSMRDSGRMTRMLGRCTEKCPYEVEVILSWNAYEKRGYKWERLRNTVKHELVHASNFVEYGHMGHGPTFIEEAKRLDVDNIARYDEPDPRYFIVCDGCGVVLWRQKKSKKVKDPERHMGYCANCNEHSWDVLEEPPASNHPRWTEKRRSF